MTTAESSIAGVRGLVPSLNGRAAVSPAAEAAAKTASLTARQALDLFSVATAKLIAGVADAPSAFDRSLLCATASLYLSAAASVSTYAAFETREEAFAARATLTGLVDALGQNTAGDRLGGLILSDIECELRRLKPAHTQVVFLLLGVKRWIASAVRTMLTSGKAGAAFETKASLQEWPEPSWLPAG